jgi:hypothetical protein
VIVSSGIDPEFNALRVLPPSEIHYPDLFRDKEKFFDMINAPQLKAKYYPDAEVL